MSPSLDQSEFAEGAAGFHGSVPPDTPQVPVKEVPGSPLSMTIDVFEDNTVRVSVAVPERLPLSFADTVMVCVPADRADVVSVAPLPITPSTFEAQDRRFEILPSSASMALPLNVIESYRLNEEPLAGAVMVTFGAAFCDGDKTVRVMVAVPERLPLSFADTVMVCVPAERTDVVSVAPLPITPSIFETQDRLFEMLPSSASTALPLNVIESYRLNEEPLAGAVMVTFGAVFSGVDELTNFTASALVEHLPAAVDTIDTLA